MARKSFNKPTPRSVAKAGVVKFIVYGGGLSFLTGTAIFFVTVPSKYGALKANSDDEENASKDEFVDIQSEDVDHMDWQQLLEIVTNHWCLLIITLSLAIYAAYVNVQIPLALGKVVNVVSNFRSTQNQDPTVGRTLSRFMSEISKPMMHTIKIYILHACLTVSYIYSLASLGENVACDLRRRLYASLLHQDMSFYDRTQCGNLLSRISSDVQQFKSTFKQVFGGGIKTSTQIIGCTISMCTISPQMSFSMIITLPVIICIGSYWGSILRKASKFAREQTCVIDEIGEECLSNMKTVKSCAMEERELNVFNTQAESVRQINARLMFDIALFQGATSLFINCLVLSTLVNGGRLVSVDGSLSQGDLMSFLVASQTLQKSLSQFSLIFSQYVKGVSCANRIFEYINMSPRIVSGSLNKSVAVHDKMTSLLTGGNIEFDKVTFKYEYGGGKGGSSKNVLNELSLKIGEGEKVALVGPSGAGKSTIASLIERFYDCQSGVVFINGYDVREYNLRWLRGEMIGYISQEPILFATSVMENIRYGRPDATDQEVMKAAREANAHDFIVHALPQGYETVIGTRGSTLSGGQKQRVAIARTLLKDAKIVILDEATSALDTNSEWVVQQALEEVMKNRTVVCIAHRLSTVQNADRIIVIDGGRVVEEGRHDELMKTSGGIYADMVKKQQFSSN